MNSTFARSSQLRLRLFSLSLPSLGLFGHLSDKFLHVCVVLFEASEAFRGPSEAVEGVNRISELNELVGLDSKPIHSHGPICLGKSLNLPFKVLPCGVGIIDQAIFQRLLLVASDTHRKLVAD